MLQQTRVNAVLDHYARFMARFPTVEALAAAEEPEVLAIWSGLGYYRRARMLHKAAKVVANDELTGTMPETAEALRKLPGIGEYTSAAIASIAFGDPVAAVDGNVERVILRLTGTATGGKSRPRSRPEPSRPKPSGRLQPGDDGTRRDNLPAKEPALPRMSRPSALPDTRRTPDNKTPQNARKGDIFRLFRAQKPQKRHTKSCSNSARTTPH